VRVPGLRVEEALRPPTRLESAVPAAGPAVTYLFQRTTADRPFRRHPSSPRDAASIPEEYSVEPVLIQEARDPEQVLRRRISPPGGRPWTADAWVSVAPGAPDAALDRMLGAGGGPVFDSSGRYEGRPALRASRAFDGRADTGWTGRLSDLGRAWIGWRGGGRGTVRSLRLVRPPTGVLPSVVGVRWRGGATPPLRVRAGGRVSLPDGVPAAAGRIEILEARGEGPGAAVGIGEVRADGLPRAVAPAHGPVRSRCGDVTVESGGRTIALRVEGRLDSLGSPLRARSCGAPVELPGGSQALTARGELFEPYLLRLRSAGTSAPAPRAAGRVLGAGQASGGRRDGVRVAPAGPARIVLAESFNEGWRASCDGRSLGAPQIADGWANGWDVEPGCRGVRFEFGPERAVRAGYAFSGAACLALLTLLLLRRRASSAPHGVQSRPAVEGALPARPLTRAMAVALPLAAVVAFVFALRAGAVALPLLTLLLWRGASVTALLAAAGGLLAVVVPVLHLAFPPEDLGGHNSSYAAEALGAHWVAVAALVLLAVALWRMLAGRARGTIH
jgi:arabinofuranan 3-O-arabinosyltransferase